MRQPLTYSALFSRILDRPERFLRNPTLFKIRCFIEGYDFAIKGGCPDREFYREFSFWVADRFAVNSSHDWQMIISFEAGSEAGALELAKRLWQEYLETQALDASGEKCLVDADNLNSIKMSELFEMLQERPALYVGHDSVIGIRSFLDGYEFALRTADIKQDDLMYADFSSWVANRFRKPASRQWDEVVSFMALSESGAFTLMRELWEDYKAEIRAQT